MYAPSVPGISIRQGYIAERDRVSVRIRQYGDQYLLSVKSAVDEQQRHEFEYAVNGADGEQMFACCTAPGVIAKTRFREPGGEGLVWDVDVFEAENRGLVVAEIELERVDQAFSRPAWLGEEVTGDSRYLNTELAKKPFCKWASPP